MSCTVGKWNPDKREPLIPVQNESRMAGLKAGHRFQCEDKDTTSFDALPLFILFLPNINLFIFLISKVLCLNSTLNKGR